MTVDTSQAISSPASPGFFVAESHAGSASDHRLVKRPKSPTAFIKPLPLPIGPPKCPDYERLSRLRMEAENYAPTKDKTTPAGTCGAYAVIQYREWAEEYRIRTRIETTCGTKPPEQGGARITENLTGRAVRKIGETCQYVAMKKGGFQTFATLTFDVAGRERIASGESTIQGEVTRFTDALSKMWARGWSEEFTVHGKRYHTAYHRAGKGVPVRHAGRENPFMYLWVVEVPDNEKGEPNPHVHILLNWRVKFAAFPAWAKRVESMWGQGFATLEKIKDSDAAGAYMMKAAGYLCKAQGKGDQGTVRGNRYSMSAECRAPDWVTLEEKQLHIMGALIADVNQHVQEKYGALLESRRQIKQAMLDTPKNWKTKRRNLGEMLFDVRKHLADNLPIVSSKYQILIKGSEAFHEFLAWAKSPGHWNAPIDWLPEKGPGENWQPGARPDTQWYARFKEVHYWRRACRVAQRLRWSDWEWQKMKASYQDDMDIMDEQDNFSDWAALAA